MKCLTSTIALMITTWFNRVSSICYFPAVYQGVYETQRVIAPMQPGTAVTNTQSTSDISYSNISILYDSITVWGYCYRRVGNNVILKEDTGGLTCFRCFHLSLHSSNILKRKRHQVASKTIVI